MKAKKRKILAIMAAALLIVTPVAGTFTAPNQAVVIAARKGHGRWSRSHRSTRRRKKTKALFTIEFNYDDSDENGRVYKAPDKHPVKLWYSGKMSVYAQAPGKDGYMWYKIGHNQWVNSYYTNKPKNANGSKIKTNNANNSETVKRPKKKRAHWVKENGQYHYYLANGKKDRIDYVGKYLIDRSGNRHKVPIKRGGNHYRDALRVAKLIARCVGHRRGDKQVKRADIAAYYVRLFADRDRYTMRGRYYSTAYGVFIKGEYSCAGTTAALGMVLHQMGFKYKHVHKNQYRHQWCQLRLDGRMGYADGDAGFAGYGSYFLHHKIVPTPSNCTLIWHMNLVDSSLNIV